MDYNINISRSNVEILYNKIEHLEEKIESIHKYLDSIGAPNGDGAGEYSIVGRFRSYIESDVYIRDKKIEYILNGK